MPEEQESSSINWRGLLLLAVAAIGGLVWIRSPLRTSRPDSPEYQERKAFGDQVVDSRLWQDPFEAVTAYQNAIKAAGSDVETNELCAHTLASLRDQISRRLAEPAPAPNQVLVMLQMVSGGPYPEDAETRVRARNAVVSALGQAGYVPWDEEHINFATTDWPNGALLRWKWTGSIPALGDSNATNRPLAIPFEWFQPDDLYLASPGRLAPSNHVLVCWLAREAFDDRPLKRLSQLLAALRSDTQKRGSESKLRFQLFDPSLRETVQGLEEEGCCAPNGFENASATNVLAGLQIYSSWSTEPDALIMKNPTRHRRENVWQAFNSHGMAFTNVTATDDELAEKLIRELELRGVDLVRNKAAVALISEWDTRYGRSLPLTFATKLMQSQRAHGLCQGATNFDDVFADLRNNATNWPQNVLRFTYLRGLDGKLPGEKSERRSAAAKSRAENIEELERPEGASQLDHVERLSVELIERDRDAKREGRPPLQAIGVLGSDVYDKLLVIQALRGRFPGCLFFTVDLDARLFHPTELSYTRNLLIASSFDLELDESLQDPIPPFRDRYQTSLFLACLTALGQVTNDLQLIQPEMFEVGHHGAYVFGVEKAEGVFNPFYSARPQALPAYIALLWGLGVLLGFLLILVFSPSLRNWLVPSAGLQSAVPRRSVFVALVLILGFMCITRCSHNQVEGEPFSFFEGISVWPAEFIRLIACFVGCGLLTYGMSLLRSNRLKLRPWVGSIAVPTDGTAPSAEHTRRGHNAKTASEPRRLSPEELSSFWRSKPFLDTTVRVLCPVQSLRDRLANAMIWLPETSVSLTANDLWRHYERWDHRWHRIFRIIPAMLLFIALAAVLMSIFGMPFRPFRGWVSNYADRVILFATVCTLVFLTFFVVDAVRTARRFTDELCSRAIELSAPKPTQDEATPGSLHSQEWRRLQFVAQHTHAVGQLVYFPFIMLLLMLVSRTTYFDRWDWPWSLVVVISVICIYALTCAIGLRRAAEKARRSELDKLNKQLLAALNNNDNADAPEPIRELIEQMKNLRDGVFAPITQQPFFRAILLTLGGATSLPLANFLPGLLGVSF